MQRTMKNLRLVDLNGDGTILAVGTKDLSFNTLVYKYDSGSWGLYGNSIYNDVSLNIPTKLITQETTTYTDYTGDPGFYIDFRQNLSAGDTINTQIGGLSGTLGTNMRIVADGVNCGSGYIQFKDYNKEWLFR